VKLVFLANLHATARSAESHRIAESRAAATVIDGQRLDEEFFDARWTVDDVGRSCVDTGVLSQHLDAEDLNAVAGSDAPAGHRGSLGTEWADFAGRRAYRRARWEEFGRVAAARLARRLGLELLAIETGGLARLDAIAEHLELDGVTVSSSADLRVELRVPSRLDGEFSMFFRHSMRAPRKGRMRTRILAEGTVFGRGGVEGADWDLWVETTHREAL
jgi:hypothetical protein